MIVTLLVRGEKHQVANLWCFVFFFSELISYFGRLSMVDKKPLLLVIGGYEVWVNEPLTAW